MRADYIVGNPPFLGNKRMRDDLGDGYTEALRAAYPDVPESADFVMYWWHKAAALVRAGAVRRFGLITTNSLRQTFNRRVVEQHLQGKPLTSALPDAETAPGNAISAPGNAVSESGNAVSESGNVVSESGNAVSESGNVVSESGNAVSESGNAVSESGNAVSESGNAVSESGNAVSESGNSVPESGKSAAPSSAATEKPTRRPARPAPALCLLFAIPDHPWVDTAEGAAVRIAMTVGGAGEQPGELRTTTTEESHDDGSSLVTFGVKSGRIAADLTTGADVAGTVPLKANEGLTSMGVMLAGRGFVIEAEEAKALVVAHAAAVGTVLRPLSNGKDLLDESRGAYVIDFTGLTVEQARSQYPELFQIVLTRVKPERDANRDAQFREKWWLFGRWRQEFRDMTRGLPRYIAAVETAKHRMFHLLDASVLPEHSLIGFGLDDAFFFGVLSSRIHVVFALAAGGTLEDRPRYNKTRCFDPFPFPACEEPAKARIRALGEELDAHRKRVQAQHPGLSLTAIYNVLAKLRAAAGIQPRMNTDEHGSEKPEPDSSVAPPCPSVAHASLLTPKDRAIHDAGLVSVLRQLHDELDAAVAEAYGWVRAGQADTTLSDAEILTRLVALNAERAAEEATGTIRWLRPEYQGRGQATQEQMKLPAGAGSKLRAPRSLPPKAPWPKPLAERVAAVERALAAAGGAVTPEVLARRFTRAKPGDLAEILETLVTLGRAHREGESYSR